MVRNLFAFILPIILLCLSVTAQKGPTSSFQAQLTELLNNWSKTYELPLQERYRSALQKAADHYRRAGELDILLEIQAELKRMESGEALYNTHGKTPIALARLSNRIRAEHSALNRRKMEVIVRFAQERYQHLAKMEKTLVIDGKIDEAIAIRNEKESILQNPSVMHARETLKLGAQQTKRTTASSAPIVPTGLLVYYPFDTNTEGVVRDAGPQKLDGELNGAIWSPRGIRGGAMSFDGRNDVLIVPMSLEQHPLTLSLWIYPRTFNEMVRVMSDDDGKYGHGFWYDEEGTISLMHYNTFSTFEARVKSETWQHVCVVWTEKRKTLYLDGQQIDSHEYDFGKFLGIDEQFTLGRGEYHEDQYQFDGMIDEFRLYNRALNAQEATTLYRQR